MNPIARLNRKLKLGPVVFVYGVVLVLLYVVFFKRYQVQYIDNAWSLSWAYGWWTFGDVFDRVFGYVHGDGGTALFSRTYVFVYGAVASLFGWTRGVGVGLSTLLILGSGGIWYVIVRKLGYSKGLALSFVLMFLVLEAFYGSAKKLRPEAPGFLLASLSFLLFLDKKFLVSGVVLMLGFETHPFAVAAGFWITGYVVSVRQDIRESVREHVRHAAFFALGLCLGLVYWFALHAPYLSGLGELGERVSGNAFLYYFFRHRYSWRHWPELLVIAGALTVFIARKAGVRHRVVLPLVVSVVLCSLLVPRGNYHYVIYLYPPLLLMVLVVASELKAVPLLLVSVLVFQVPQYAYMFWEQRTFDDREFVNDLRKRVPDDGRLIYGFSSAWFALYDREFKAYNYFRASGLEPADWPDEFYVLADSSYARVYRDSDIVRGLGQFGEELLERWTTPDGSELSLWILKRTVSKTE